MNTNLLPADTFVVINKTILNDQDRKILVMLYQPIIGTVATNLYFTLWSYLDKTELLSEIWTHHHLITNMGIKLSDIVEARQKLEAIGLIKTYYKEGSVNSYAYLLYSPMPASEFLNNPILSTALYSNIGANEYKSTVEYFKIPKIKLNDFVDISCSFRDIFEMSSLYNVNNTDIRKVSQNGIDIVSKVDVDNILSIIPNELLNFRSVTKDLRELIQKLSFTYDLNDDEMTEIIRNSINEKHSIDKEMLRKNCQDYYQFSNSGKLPSLIFRTQPEYLRKPIGDNSNKAKLIYQFETTAPYDFIASKYKDSKPTKADLAVIEYLLVDLNMKPGVVNVLIDYVHKINNNKLTKAFVEAIAAQWKKSKVETVEAAMDIAIKELKGKKKVESSKATPQNRRVVSKPNWMDKEIEATTNSNDEAELEKLLAEFR